MKHVSIIIKLHLYTFFISLLIGQSSPYRYSLFPGTPNLEDIYIVEEEEVFALIMEFSGANFDYVANEIFAPPSLNLTFKNVKWGKGNFSKKGDHSPLYQYSLQIPRNANQKEVKERVNVKLDFTRVPDYKIKMIPAKGKKKQHTLKITWDKTRTKKKPLKKQTMARRLPPSRVSINFQDAKLVNAVRMLSLIHI